MMLLEQVFAINTHGFAHRDLHPGNIWISEDFDDVQIIGFYNACSSSRKRDIIATGTPPYFLNRHGCWSPGSFRWDLHAWAVIAAEMMINVEWFKTYLNGREFWRVVECSS
jgi:serine/threonine protein kinase